jgi:hypothetical protein
MAERCGDWKGLSLCCVVAAILIVDKLMHRFLRLTRSFLDVSPLRKAFTGLSLLAITYFLSSAIAEQAVDVLNPREPILRFTAAAITATLLFWVWEEILEVSRTHRLLFIALAGILIILALHHEVTWAMAAADDAGKKIETDEARNCKNEVVALRDRATMRKLYSTLTVASPKPPEVTNRQPEIPKPRPHEEPQSPLPETPVQLSAKFYNPQAPSIVVSNPSDHVVENVNYGIVLFRTADLSFFSFSTQTIGYVKPQTSSATYVMPTTPASSEGNAQLADGDELTGSVSVDCPKCKIQTYIIHFVWAHSGWFFESQQKAGYIVPKDMSKDGRAKYIQLLTSDMFAKERTEIVPKQP